MKRRGWLLIGLGFLLAVVVASWVNSRNQAYPGHLDPQNPGPGGAQALARVLGDQGVRVEVVRTRAAFDATTTGDALIVVTATSQLGRSTTDDLVDHASGSPVVLVAPGPDVLDLLDAGAVTDRLLPDQSLEARCERFSGLRLEVDEALAYRASGQACFPVEAGALLTSPAPGLTVLGAAGVLANEQILRADNAAVALRLLGSADHLVWYVPTTADLAAGDEVGLGSLLPRWLVPGLWVLLLATVALIVWRGRRLGKLAIEPLPVSVKAIETTQSRGRLYRKANDRAHAAGSLRHAARTRVIERLGLPPDADADELLSVLAPATARAPHELRDLLYGAPPSGDRGLIQLATALAELDDQLRKAPR
jgi:hypothetical protein